MSTVNKELAKEIIAADGYYKDDPRVLQVIKYQNHWGGKAYALLYLADVKYNRYEESDYIVNPVVIWQASDVSELAV